MVINSKSIYSISRIFSQSHVEITSYGFKFPIINHLIIKSLVITILFAIKFRVIYRLHSKHFRYHHENSYGEWLQQTC